MSFKFENLKVWQKSRELSLSIHSLTLTFPKNEMFVLASQIKRAADSVALNIAEGSTSQSNKEFVRFINIAIRSAIEVVSCLYLAKDRDLIEIDCFDRLYSQTEEICKMLYGLKKQWVKKILL